MNEERLFPFLGGLVIGGIGGASFETNKFGRPNYYYPTNYGYYYYPQQVSYQYPYYGYQMPMTPASNIESTQSSVKIISESPSSIDVSLNRDFNDLAMVPKYEG